MSCDFLCYESVFGLFTDGFHVPSIQPLETLHNALTLRQVENFIQNVTDMHCRTPPLCITPSTPPQSQQPTQLSLHPVHLTVPSPNQPLGMLCQQRVLCLSTSQRSQYTIKKFSQKLRFFGRLMNDAEQDTCFSLQGGEHLDPCSLY